MNTHESLKLELITNDDFLNYLSVNLMKLPQEFQSQITKIEDISGNVNRVKRVSFGSDSNSSLIVKHVPKDGKLAKYPTISFASNRLDFEYKWFNQTNDALNKIENSRIIVPKIFLFDQSIRLIAMQDLGTVSFSSFLASHTIECSQLLSKLGTTFATTHNQSINHRVEKNTSASQNRPFIFSFHLTDPDTVKDIWKSSYSKENSISLENKLNLQEEFIDNKSKELLPILSELEKSFSNNPEPVFTHGDLHTNSIIVTDERKIGIIDAELSDFGDRAFDIGSLSAHLIAEQTSRDKPYKELIQQLIDGYLMAYKRKEPEMNYCFKERVVKFLGAELLRRLMGPAGFNVNLTLEQFEHLTVLSYDCLLNTNSPLQQIVIDNY